MPQLILLATALVNAIIVSIPVTVSIIYALVDSVHTASTLVPTTSFLSIPLTAKGNSIFTDDEVDLPLFTFKTRSSSYLALPHS